MCYFNTYEENLNDKVYQSFIIIIVLLKLLRQKKRNAAGNAQI